MFVCTKWKELSNITKWTTAAAIGNVDLLCCERKSKHCGKVTHYVPNGVCWNVRHFCRNKYFSAIINHILKLQHVP